MPRIRRSFRAEKDQSITKSMDDEKSCHKRHSVKNNASGRLPTNEGKCYRGEENNERPRMILRNNKVKYQEKGDSKPQKQSSDQLNGKVTRSITTGNKSGSPNLHYKGSENFCPNANKQSPFMVLRSQKVKKQTYCLKPGKNRPIEENLTQNNGACSSSDAGKLALEMHETTAKESRRMSLIPIKHDSTLKGKLNDIKDFKEELSKPKELGINNP